jgi:hypothetical protein
MTTPNVLHGVYRVECPSTSGGAGDVRYNGFLEFYWYGERVTPERFQELFRGPQQQRKGEA